MDRAQFLADFKETFQTWIKTYDAKCTATDYTVEWDNPSIQSAWSGWVSSYETYAVVSTGYLTGSYNSQE